MLTRNDVEIEEEKTESSILQELPSDEVETDEVTSYYGSTFESFRSKDKDDPCLLETEESEKKKKNMTTSDQQHTVEKDEVSSDEVEMDDDSTIGPLRSSTSLSMSECRWDPCLEVEEYDEGFVVFSRLSSSKSSLSPSQFDSSFSRSQPELHLKLRRPNFFKSLLEVPRRVIGKPTLITPPMMISYQDAFKVFTEKELRKATNNYSWVIGRGGGSNVVYKGILDDQRVVAVKTSLFVDGSYSIEEKVNEMLVLSQINHVNVVKLVGCCLEAKPLMLVCEYMSNGSLFDLIHLKRDHPVVFPLATRLKMAAEAAEAVAYLHSGASPPILHGDVKSSNILLDEDCTVKLCDFGVSVLASNDKRRFMTNVKGTLGYLDPEYMFTGELTDKSDVFSFGVVLLELLTRRRAIMDFNSTKQLELRIRFLDCMRENHLFDILDPEITMEGLTEQLQKVTDLAARCLEDKGSDRPTMKEVHRELEASTISTTTLHRLPFSFTVDQVDPQ